MHILKRNHNYKYPFPIVVSSYWQRYPNPSNSDVISIDTFKREFDYENQRLTNYRIVRYNLHAPRSLVPVFNYLGMDAVVTGIETSVYDLKRNKLKITARNISGAPLMKMLEVCHYKEKKDGTTDYNYQISVDVQALGLGSIVESKGIQMLKKQTVKSFKSLEEICETMQQKELQKEMKNEMRNEVKKATRFRDRLKRLMSKDISFDEVGKSLGNFE